MYGLLAKGVYGHDEPLDRIEDIAAYCINAMRSVRPTGPYALSGYCLGGVIAFLVTMRVLSRCFACEANPCGVLTVRPWAGAS